MGIRTFDMDRDYAAVMAVWRAAEGVHLGQSDTPTAIARKLERDPELFLVAEADGQIVGAVMGGFDGRRGLVYHLAVQAAYQQQGVGSALMAELEARLRAKGCHKVYLFVEADNAQVVEFYRRRGWDDMEVRPMAKELDRPHRSPS
jgi:ribosomal protein S18 acetylase RimI-like enzyme